MTAEVDPTTTIHYGRPRYLAPVLAIIAVAAAIAAVVSYLTYGRVESASVEDVLANRVVTQELRKLVTEYEQENSAHRDRNEEAHACIAVLLRELLDRHGARFALDIVMPDPCKAWAHIGVATHPTTTTTATVRRRQTTTSRSQSTSNPTTTQTTPSTARATTTTNCMAFVQGDCLR
jgi:hypothetical protein